MLQTTAVSSTVVRVELPSDATNIVFQNNGSAVLRYCFDANTPTVSSGIRLLAGEKFALTAKPDIRLRGAVRFIAESGSSTIDVIADAP